MSEVKRYTLIALLLSLLACVRAFEATLFYDPLLNYYRVDFSELPMPSFNLTLLTANLLFRYGLNTIISLAIIQVWFGKSELTKFSAILFALLFVILITAFLLTITSFPEHKMMLFYIRRFLIHPIFVILFIPAFLFQQKVAGNKYG